MADRKGILECFQDEAYVEANWQFIRQERATIDAFFTELVAEVEDNAEKLHEPELRLSPMYPEPGTEI